MADRVCASAQKIRGRSGPLIRQFRIDEETRIVNHELPKLPYAQDALVPHLSLETMQYHYGKHHQAYVDNLNKLIKGTEFAELPLEAIIKRAPAGGIFNNAAQVSNHSFFWQSMTPEGGDSPKGALAEAIAKTWGSVDKFNELFLAQAVGNFGSGWTWLVKKADGSLAVTSTTGAQTPLTGSDKPLLTLDVWEHAYYIDYRNQRPKFVESYLTHLVNWPFAASNFA
jgi:Fe-Mn family superoxide dismutase